MDPALRVALYVSAARRIQRHIQLFLTAVVPLVKELRIYQLAAVVEADCFFSGSTNDFVHRRVDASHRLMCVIDSLRQWTETAFDQYQRDIFAQFFQYSDQYWNNSLKNLQEEATRRIELFSAIEQIYCTGFEMTGRRQ